MPEHPIQGLMKTSMESIKEMIDVDVVVGEPVETPDGSVIIPVSRVSFGFIAGGTDFESQAEPRRNSDAANAVIPFGGGSGAGVTVQPVGFLVVGQGVIRLLPVGGTAIYDRLIELAPQLVKQLRAIITGEELE